MATKTKGNASEMTDSEMMQLLTGTDGTDYSDPADEGVDTPLSDLADHDESAQPFQPTQNDINLAKSQLKAGDMPSLPIPDVGPHCDVEGWKRVKSFKVQQDGLAKPDTRHHVISLEQFLSTIKPTAGYAITGYGRGFVRVTCYVKLA